MAASHIPLKILKKRLDHLELIVAVRQARGARQPKNKVPLWVLEKRLARLNLLVGRRS